LWTEHTRNGLTFGKPLQEEKKMLRDRKSLEGHKIAGTKQLLLLIDADKKGKISK
jgi:hypothetical protein